jgi:hypothetical protein
VDAFDTEQRIRARAPAPTGTRHRVIHVRVSLPYWFARSLPIQRGPDLFPAAPRRTTPHHAAPRRTTQVGESQTVLAMLICEEPLKQGSNESSHIALGLDQRQFTKNVFNLSLGVDVEVRVSQ